MSRKRSSVPVRVIDTATGREMVVYQNPHFDQRSQVPMHAPVYYPQPIEDDYYPPARRRKSRRTSRRELRRRESKARFAGVFFGAFILSWVPTAFFMPGVTLALWGIGGAYLLYKAVR